MPLTFFDKNKLFCVPFCKFSWKELSGNSFKIYFNFLKSSKRWVRLIVLFCFFSSFPFQILVFFEFTPPFLSLGKFLAILETCPKLVSNLAKTCPNLLQNLVTRRGWYSMSLTLPSFFFFPKQSEGVIVFFTPFFVIHQPKGDSYP